MYAHLCECKSLCVLCAYTFVYLCVCVLKSGCECACSRVNVFSCAHARMCV